MAFVAFGALVDDLAFVVSIGIAMLDRKSELAYHSSDLFPAMRHLNAAATVGSVVPRLTTESSAVESRGESVGGERASPALHVSTVEGRLTRHGATSDEVLIGTLAWDRGCDGGTGGRKDGKCDLEKHRDDGVDRSIVWKEWIEK